MPLELVRLTLLQGRADRIPLAVPGYLLACLVLVPLASHLSLGAGARAAWEVGLTLQWVIVSLTGGWLGLRAVGLDLAHRTSGVFLSGPVAPATWLFGRAIGIAAILGALIASLQLTWMAICLWRGLEIPVAALGAMSLALWIEGSLVAGVTALLSTRANPLVASGASAGVFMAGHLSTEYTLLVDEWGAGALSLVVYALIPDLDIFDLQTAIVTQAAIPTSRVLWLLVYGGLWMVALIALTVLSLRTRDLA